MNIPWPDEIIVMRVKSLVSEICVSIAVMLLSLFFLGGYSFIVLFFGIVFIAFDFYRFLNTMKSNAFVLKDNNFILNPIHRFHIQNKKVPADDVEEVVLLKKSGKFGISFENGKLILNMRGVSQSAVEKIQNALNTKGILVTNRIT